MSDARLVWRIRPIPMDTTMTLSVRDTPFVVNKTAMGLCTTRLGLLIRGCMVVRKVCMRALTVSLAQRTLTDQRPSICRLR